MELAQTLNFPQLKMYFMLGHPTETDDDIQGIVDLTLKARKLFRRNVAINATPFVPKAHAFPIYADGACEDRGRPAARPMKALAPHGVTVDADPPEWAEVQGVLSRATGGWRRCCGTQARDRAGLLGGHE